MSISYMSTRFLEEVLPSQWGVCFIKSLRTFWEFLTPRVFVPDNASLCPPTA